MIEIANGSRVNETKAMQTFSDLFDLKRKARWTEDLGHRKMVPLQNMSPEFGLSSRDVLVRRCPEKRASG